MRIVILAALLVSLAGGAAWADEIEADVAADVEVEGEDEHEDDWTFETHSVHRSGGYVGLSYLYASPTDARMQGDGSTGITARVGYHFAKAWAIEFQYARVDGFELAEPYEGLTAQNLNLFTLNSRFYLLPYFTQAEVGLQPFVSGGLGLIEFEAKTCIPTGNFFECEEIFLPPGNDGGFVGRIGGGVDIYLWEHFAVTVEGVWVAPTGAGDSLAYGAVEAGAIWRFAPLVY